MFVPIPLLIIGAIAVLGLLAWALFRGGGDRRGDLTAPPPRFDPPVRHGQDRPAGTWSATGPAAVVAGDDGVAELTDELRDEVRELLRSGQKIVANKLVREQTGLGLREAKDLVEAL